MPLSVQSPADRERKRVLLVEQDDHLRRSLQLLLEGWGFEVRSFPSTMLALGDPLSTDADVFLVDSHFASGASANLLAALRGRGWRGRAILMSSAPEDVHHGVAAHAGFAAVVRHPPRQVELLSALGR